MIKKELIHLLDNNLIDEDYSSALTTLRQYLLTDYNELADLRERLGDHEDFYDNDYCLLGNVLESLDTLIRIVEKEHEQC